MKARILSIFVFTLCFFKDSHQASMFDSFNGFSPLKKLAVQSQKTYEKFKDQFTKQLLQNEITNPETKEKLLQAGREVGNARQIDEYLSSVGPTENPQIHLGKLAFIYSVMNRAELAAAMSINRICAVESLLNPKTNPNVCETYVPHFAKLIEMRIGVVTSRIVFSNGIVGIPKGWTDHVQSIVKDLETTGMLSDSLRNLLYLLRGVGKINGEEVEEANDNGAALIAPKPFYHSMIPEKSAGIQENPSNSQPIVIPPPPVNVNIDTTNLVKELRSKKETDTLDSIISQVLPKMMIL